MWCWRIRGEHDFLPSSPWPQQSAGVRWAKCCRVCSSRFAALFSRWTKLASGSQSTLQSLTEYFVMYVGSEFSEGLLEMEMWREWSDCWAECQMRLSSKRGLCCLPVCVSLCSPVGCTASCRDGVSGFSIRKYKEQQAAFCVISRFHAHRVEISDSHAAHK